MVQEQPSRVGRRLSAIVAADVAGYSRLMGLDEAGTARILREHRVITDPVIAKHGGRIVKTMGDGLLIEFPRPSCLFAIIVRDHLELHILLHGHNTRSPTLCLRWNSRDHPH